jgi:hypothetical protein
MVPQLYFDQFKVQFPEVRLCPISCSCLKSVLSSGCERIGLKSITQKPKRNQSLERILAQDQQPKTASPTSEVTP